MTDENGNIQYRLGIPEEHRQCAAALYDEAFGAKFSVAISSKEKRIALISSGLNLNFGVCAIQGHQLVGLAGFHTGKGSLTAAITYRSLLAQLGFFKGNWAALIFSLYERTPKPKELVMDGIAVLSQARGTGVGSRLIKELFHYAAEHSFETIRLDVIDTNGRAKNLYERMGFRSIKTEHFECLRWLLGFGGSTTMEFLLTKGSHT